MALIREIHDKGALEIQHGKRKVGRLDTADKQKAIWKIMSEDKSEKGRNEQGPI